MALSKEIESILRVNHAGELGAKQIYKAQRRILGDEPELVLMANQEEQHLKTFAKLMVENRVKPTLMQPLWHVLSYGMGAVTALMGKQAAHACTIAVEEVIVEHYQEQIDVLENRPEHQELCATIQQFQKEEDHHKEIAQNNGGENAKNYEHIKKVVGNITKLAIAVSKKI
jgi:ubiquinone biosynthesis monooxygenase Coq7